MRYAHAAEKYLRAVYSHAGTLAVNIIARQVRKVASESVYQYLFIRL